MKQLKTLSSQLALALTLLTTAACPGGGDPIEDSVCDAELDSDADGLDDCVEHALGTAPHLADTDGDGLSDYDEVVEYGYSAENNNYKFNPLIADTPKVRVDITSAPSLALLYTESDEKIVAASTEHEKGTSVGRSYAGSETNSQSVEYSETHGESVTASVEVSFPAGASASASGTISYESSTATTSETSHTWSEEESQENSNTVTRAEEFAIAQGKEINGGALSATVSVVNEGDIAYTLSNVALSAFMIAPGRQQILSPVGGLNLDDDQPSFAQFSYAPGQRNGPFVFLNDGLDTATAKALMQDSTGLNLRVVAYELTDEEGRSFTHDQTKISARTATIIVDYNDVSGDYNTLSTERYQVATNTDPESLRITAQHALSEVLNIPFEVDEGGALDSVRDLASDAETTGHWVVIHKSTDGILDSVEHHSQERDLYDFSKLELKSGDVLHLVYVEDADGDGLGTRLEALSGTDPLNPDTDEDGLSDGDEVNYYKSNPLLVHSDDDGIEDGVEALKWKSDPVKSDSDDDGIRDDIDLFSFVGAGRTMSAVTASGELWKWGNDYGAPAVVGEGDITELHQGYEYSIVRDQEGGYYGVGTSFSGIENGYSPNAFTGVLLEESFTVISMADQHALAIADDGSLWSWGNSAEGKLGLGEDCQDLCNIPPTMVSDDSWIAVSAGRKRSFGIKADGSLWAWGNNHGAALGVGFSFKPYLRPVRVGNDNDWRSVSAGLHTTIALKDNGSLWGWGIYADSSRPSQMGSDTDWSQISSGTSHMLAIKSDRSLWGLGRSDHGELGLGDILEVREWTQIGNDKHWIHIDANDYISAAISADHNLWTWGSDWFDGSLAHEPNAGSKSTVPAQVRLSR